MLPLFPSRRQAVTPTRSGESHDAWAGQLFPASRTPHKRRLPRPVATPVQTAALIRQQQQTRCCSLIYNCPFLGCQAHPPADPASIPPSKPVRPHIVGANFVSFASSRAKRFAGLPREFGRAFRVLAPQEVFSPPHRRGTAAQRQEKPPQSVSPGKMIPYHAAAAAAELCGTVCGEPKAGFLFEIVTHFKVEVCYNSVTFLKFHPRSAGKRRQHLAQRTTRA